MTADRTPIEAGGGGQLVDSVAGPYQDISGGAGGCPAGTHYMGISRTGMSPLPLPSGLRWNSPRLESRGPLDVLGAVRRHSPPHVARRAMRGERDERPLRGLPRPGVRDQRRSDGRRPALYPHPRQFAGSPPLMLGGASQAGVPATRSVRGGVEVAPPERSGAMGSPRAMAMGEAAARSAPVS